MSAVNVGNPQGLSLNILLSAINPIRFHCSVSVQPIQVSRGTHFRAAEAQPRSASHRP